MGSRDVESGVRLNPLATYRPLRRVSGEYRCGRDWSRGYNKARILGSETP